MRGRLMIGGVLIASITLLGLGGPALAQDGVAREQLPRSLGGMMHDMMGGGMMDHGGMMGIVPSKGEESGGIEHQRGFLLRRPISLMLEMREELKLTPDQVAKLETLRSDLQRRAEEKFQILRERHRELRQTLGADRVDLVRAEATLKDIGSIRTELALDRLNVIEQGKAVLTPDQGEELKSLSTQAHCPGKKT